jgi:hypothetical protein
MNYQLAQINIAKLIAPITDPLISDFVGQLDMINALAEQSEGFVWRLKDDSNNATNINPFNDRLIIVNISVWESIEDLKNFVYKSHHIKVFADRTKWFEKMQEAHLALWWIEEGKFPSAEEAKEKLLHLRKYGDSVNVFSFKNSIEKPLNSK